MPLLQMVDELKYTYRDSIRNIIPAHVGSIIGAETKGVSFDSMFHVGSAVVVEVKPFNNKD